MKQFRNIINILFIIFLANQSNVWAQKNDDLLQKKAGYIKNLSIFTTWPQNTNSNEEKKLFTIGIIGETPLHDCLVNFYADKKIKNCKVKIQQFYRLDEITNCDLLFIASSKQDELTQIIDCVKNSPILTLSDFAGFAEKGILINFYHEKETNKLSFEINETALKKSGLYISYLLLKEAKIISPIKH